jgi:hypothetical protein
MIPKSGNRFSEKIMRQQKSRLGRRKKQEFTGTRLAGPAAASVQTCAISNDLQRFTMAAEGQGARKQDGYGSCVRTIRGRREPLRAQKTGIYRDASRRRAKAALRIAARVLNQQRSATIHNARRCRAASEPRRGEEAIQVLASLGGPAHPASSDSATICNAAPPSRANGSGPEWPAR